MSLHPNVSPTQCLSNPMSLQPNVSRCTVVLMVSLIQLVRAWVCRYEDGFRYTYAAVVVAGISLIGFLTMLIILSRLSRDDSSDDLVQQEMLENANIRVGGDWGYTVPLPPARRRLRFIVAVAHWLLLHSYMNSCLVLRWPETYIYLISPPFFCYSSCVHCMLSIDSLIYC